MIRDCQPPRIRSRRRYAGRLGLVVLLAGCAAGCRSWRGGAVSADVAQCRQLTQQGLIAAEQGDPQRAQQFLEQAVQTCPGDADARRELAAACCRAGDNAAALVHLEAALKAAPRDADLLIRHGELSLQLGRDQEAWLRANQAIAADSRRAAAWLLRGRVRQQARQLDEALADYLRALDYQSDDPAAMLAAAGVYLELQRPTQALALAKSCLAPHETSSPQAAPALALAGRAALALGRPDEAAGYFTQALERTPQSSDLWTQLAAAEQAAGRPDTASQAARQAQSLPSASTPPPRIAHDPAAVRR